MSFSSLLSPSALLPLHGSGRRSSITRLALSRNRQCPRCSAPPHRSSSSPSSSLSSSFPSPPLTALLSPSTPAAFHRRDLKSTTRARRCSATPPEGKDSGKSDDEPIWVKREQEESLRSKQGGGSDLPYGVYLLLSSIILIAAVGSIFEFAYGNAIFGVIQSDSFLYKPILVIFIMTGFPVSALIWKKAVDIANKEAEIQDKLDGFD